MGKFLNTPKVDFIYAGKNNKQFVRLLEPLQYLSDAEVVFDVELDYVSDGASIPKIAWSLVGHPFSPRVIKAALLHDRLCEMVGKKFKTLSQQLNYMLKHKILTSSGAEQLKQLGDIFTQKRVDKYFLEALHSEGVVFWRRYGMYLAIRAFGWIHRWNNKRKQDNARKRKKVRL